MCFSQMLFMEIMMYQRASSSKIAPMDGGDKINAMTLVKFLKAAKEDLEAKGKQDEAYVIEMLEDHFRGNKPLVYNSMVFCL